ncbi:MAG: Obg family GTPase CgtA, partial [Dehalococcoidales bacterium]|nr:Obg family GTPase CgtA [Dehalococcoidales bacterium]
GEDLRITVPVGTVVLLETATGDSSLLADLERPEEQVVVTRGGKGGRGNVHFASATNQVPQLAEKGEVGEELIITLEMRLIADVGIIGYPNVGKSTLLAQASAAKPKIASYPFTTLNPVLGVVNIGERRLILAEIPGLISGAYRGRGLGHNFLRHITRTRVLIHLVDGSSGHPEEDMVRVNIELGRFDTGLASKPQLVVINKLDLAEVRARQGEIKHSFRQLGIVPWFISAVTGEGVSELMTEAINLLDETVATSPPPRVMEKVFHPLPRDAGLRVRKDGNTFVVEAAEVERIIARVDISSSQVSGQIKQRLRCLGVDRVLRRAGIKPGGKVRCGNLEWEWV